MLRIAVHCHRPPADQSRLADLGEDEDSGAGHLRPRGDARGCSSAFCLRASASLPSPHGTASREPEGENRDGPVALCSLLQRRTCLIDGDTGRDNGKKWRLISIDTPELSEPECDNERRLGTAARDRLRALLAGGYRIRPSGRDGPARARARRYRAARRTRRQPYSPQGRAGRSRGPIGVTCGATDTPAPCPPEDDVDVTIIPTMRYRDAAKMIDWLGEAFGFERRMVIDDGNRPRRAHPRQRHDHARLGARR